MNGIYETGNPDKDRFTSRSPLGPLLKSCLLISGHPYLPAVSIECRTRHQRRIQKVSKLRWSYPFRTIEARISVRCLGNRGEKLASLHIMDVMSVYGRYPKDSPISDRVAPVDRVCRPFAARCRTGSDVTGNGQPQRPRYLL